MPVDHKRIACPENTVPYHLFSRLNLKSFNERFQEAVKEDGTRKEGRKHDEQRKIFVKTGIVSQAKGSAYIEIGKTKVISSVFDPREIPKKVEYSLKGELYCEFKYAPFSCPKRRMHQQDSEEKQNSVILKRALESVVCRHEFPNFQVDIYVLVLQNDGGAVSAAINCAGVALAHAGVPMYDIVTSSTLGFQGDVKLLDPTLEEEGLCENTVSSGEAKNKTHQRFYQSGSLTFDELNSSVEILTKANKEIVPLIEKCLVKHVMKSLKENVED